MTTRRALQQAALSLFAERGYEETTVADIAARAEVGLRTFFVHFPTKEDVLFDGSHEDFPDLFRLIVSAPEGLSDLAALEAALLAVEQRARPTGRCILIKMTQLLVRSAATSSVVRGRRAANGDKIASVVVAALFPPTREDIRAWPRSSSQKRPCGCSISRSRSGSRRPHRTSSPSSCATSPPCARGGQGSRPDCPAPGQVPPAGFAAQGECGEPTPCFLHHPVSPPSR